jgi:hypothetical protein
MDDFIDFVSFFILGQEVNIISDETELGINTVAELNDQFYYLGDQPPDILSAIYAYQKVNNLILTSDEFQKVLEENEAFDDLQ